MTHRIKFAIGLSAILAVVRIPILFKILAINGGENLLMAVLGVELGIGVELIISIVITSLLMWYVIDRKRK